MSFPRCRTQKQTLLRTTRSVHTKINWRMLQSSSLNCVEHSTANLTARRVSWSVSRPRLRP
ncbi:hypothetical protein F441_04773 [Phytophthora nicotianae CJ01A1]|uniref:Uncharacterized protein n=1 Tax=Phytophthora nicotianae CJ01A1 TaxID=1317063 RepID=W2XGJ5_PHYNI|nr:hypothetical protein F441_04773 [Phytophthora nicotianae CJ01A1]